MRLHRELSKSLLEETGIDVDFRVRSSLALAFTEADVRRLQVALPWQQRQPGYAVRWLDIAEARRVEPRISDEKLGATLIEGGGAVEPYRLVALTRAAERLGVMVRHGRAIGLRRAGGRITGVVLEREVLSCATAVLALGPWSAEASDWIGVPIDVRPLKGQILRLQRSEEHTSELQSRSDLVCRLLLEKKNAKTSATVDATLTHVTKF